MNRLLIALLLSPVFFKIGQATDDKFAESSGCLKASNGGPWACPENITAPEPKPLTTRWIYFLAYYDVAAIKGHQQNQIVELGLRSDHMVIWR